MEKDSTIKFKENGSDTGKVLAAAMEKYQRVEQIFPETVIRLKQGDHRAFNAVYTAFADPMLKFLRYILRNEEDAKEIVQEIFMNLWTQRANIDPNKSIKNYLYTATRNRAFNLLREQNVRFRFIQDGMAAADDATNDSSHDLLQSKQTRLIIEAVVLRMPPQRRLIFDMSRNRGMSHEQIAEELGITTGTVAQHITSALKSIREVLALLLFFFCD